MVEKAWSNFIEDLENKIQKQKKILFDLKNAEINSLKSSIVSEEDSSNDDNMLSLAR